VSEDRTEKPTAKRLREAREKGQVLRSRDVHDVAQLGGVLLALTWFGRPLVEGLGRAVSAGLVEVGASAHRTISETDLSAMTMQTGKVLAMLVGPIALAAVIGGLLATTAQGGWNFTGQPLAFNFEKLNPAAGLKKLAPTRAGFDLLRTLVVLMGLVWIAIGSIQAMVDDTLTIGRVTTAQSAMLAWSVAETYLHRAWVVMATTRCSAIATCRACA
jgi:flagellar biosynthesis protein FlhB